MSVLFWNLVLTEIHLVLFFEKCKIKWKPVGVFLFFIRGGGGGGGGGTDRETDRERRGGIRVQGIKKTKWKPDIEN